MRAREPELKKATKNDLKKVFQRLGRVSLKDYDTRRDLDAIRLQRHQSHYRLILAICKFILDNTVFNENRGVYEFLDFERDHQRMAALFERFVFNFYKRHLGPPWRVRSEDIRWQYEPGGIGVEYLPKMQTDITIEGPDRKLIIDTKFYQDPLEGQWSRRFHTANLYQLHAYLSNVARTDFHPRNPQAEGMLLYARTADAELPRLDARILGHRFRVESIDLDQPWKGIETALLALFHQDPLS